MVSQSSTSSMARLLIAVSLLIAAFLPALAQDELSRTEQTSPATGHAQVIAHGVTPLPPGNYFWRVEEVRALPPNRTLAAKQDAGFVLAAEDPIALTNGRGHVL